MTITSFTKMNGLGNDFVVMDGREQPVNLTSTQVRAISNRHTGIGCDQIVIIEHPRESKIFNPADVFIRIFNADGSEINACGNATRCVAALMYIENQIKKIMIETKAGFLESELLDNSKIAVDMGKPVFLWQDIPLSENQNTKALDIVFGKLSSPAAISMGNPHCVFFVEYLDKIILEEIGPVIENHRLFPQRTNVGVAQIKDTDLIRLRVWERGVGITLACGTGACAAAVAANRANLVEREVIVELDGGRLEINWRPDDHVIMTGPAATSFSGAVDLELLA